MKNYILIAVACLSLTACDPGKYLVCDNATWNIQNNLEQPIKVFIPAYEKDERPTNLVTYHKDSIIPPGKSIRIQYQVNKTHLNKTKFDLLYDGADWGSMDEQDQRIDILSIDGKVLKTWYSAKKDESGKQFFNEKGWRLYKMLGEDVSGATIYRWVFKITDQDIAPITEQASQNNKDD